jgi:hypothetical protein
MLTALTVLCCLLLCYLSTGTDCQDCGPVGFDNFTRNDDDGWWDDDDDYWSFNDANFVGTWARLLCDTLYAA